MALYEYIAAVERTRVRIIFDFGVPGLQSFLDSLASYVTIRKPVTEKWSPGWSLADLQALDRAELEQRMTDFARSGRSGVARTIAQLAYNCTGDEACRLVESLRRGDVPAYPPGERLTA